MQTTASRILQRAGRSQRVYRQITLFFGMHKCEAAIDDMDGTATHIPTLRPSGRAARDTQTVRHGCQGYQGGFTPASCCRLALSCVAATAPLISHPAEGVGRNRPHRTRHRALRLP